MSLSHPNFASGKQKHRPATIDTVEDCRTISPHDILWIDIFDVSLHHW